MSRDGIPLDAHTVEFSRLLPGPIELAWDYLTRPELLRIWFADATLEPRVGGAIEFRFGPDEDPDCEAGGVRGTIREFRPPRLLAYSWQPRRRREDGTFAAVDEGEVRLELAEQGGRVLLTLRHSRIPAAALAGYGRGWRAYLGALEARLAGGVAVAVAESQGRPRPARRDRLAASRRAGAPS